MLGTGASLFCTFPTVIKPGIPHNETERLEALYELDLLYSEPEEAYDEVAVLASQIAETPISLITLIDAEKQWFKSKVGTEGSETDREIAFCSHAILQEEPMIVGNMLEDERFAENPLVVNDPSVRFYAGFPLLTPEGYALGTLCVLDNKPRELSPDQIFGLQTLANQVLRTIRLRRALKDEVTKSQVIEEQRDELLQSKGTQERILNMLSRDVREPLSGLKSILQLMFQGDWSIEEMEDVGPDVLNRLDQTQHLIDHLIHWGKVRSDMSVHLEEVPIRGILQEQLDRFNHVTREQKVSWDLDLRENEAFRADLERMRFILRNLIKRILEHTSNKEIKVHLIHHTDLSTLHISNVGCTREHWKSHRAETELIDDFMKDMNGDIDITTNERTSVIALSLPLEPFNGFG